MTKLLHYALFFAILPIAIAAMEAGKTIDLVTTDEGTVTALKQIVTESKTWEAVLDYCSESSSIESGMDLATTTTIVSFLKLINKKKLDSLEKEISYDHLKPYCALITIAENLDIPDLLKIVNRLIAKKLRSPEQQQEFMRNPTMSNLFTFSQYQHTAITTHLFAGNILLEPLLQQYGKPEDFAEQLPPDTYDQCKPIAALNITPHITKKCPYEPAVNFFTHAATAYLFNTETNQCYQQLTFPHSIVSAYWSTVPPYPLACVLHNGDIVIWRIENHNAHLLNTLHPEDPTCNIPFWITKTCWHPTLPHTLACALNNGHIIIWQTETGNCFTLSENRNEISALAWSSRNNTLIASASKEDNTIRIWNSTTKKEVYHYNVHTQTITDLVWHPEHADILISGSKDMSICITDTTTENYIRLQGHTPSICSLFWHQEKNLLIALSSEPDGTKKSYAWDVEPFITFLYAWRQCTIPQIQLLKLLQETNLTVEDKPHLKQLFNILPPIMKQLLHTYYDRLSHACSDKADQAPYSNSNYLRTFTTYGSVAIMASKLTVLSSWFKQKESSCA